MPIWLRRYTFNEIKEYYQEEAKQTQQVDTTQTNKAKGPDINPTYTSKASKK